MTAEEAVAVLVERMASGPERTRLETSIYVLEKVSE